LPPALGLAARADGIMVDVQIPKAGEGSLATGPQFAAPR